MWAFRTNYANADINDEDVTLYHKITTFEVLVCLRDETELRVKRAEEFQLTFRKGDDPQNATDESSTVVVTPS